MSNTEKMIEILRRLKPEMNGAVAGAMEQRGLKYGLNYGVSVATIKLIAKAYAPDHGFAQHLFRQDVRELKIAAAYIDDPLEVTAEQMTQWAENFTTDEVAQHCATQLFYAAPCSEDVVCQWIAANVHIKQALYIIGKRAATKMLTRPDFFIENITKGINNSTITDINSSVYALCKIASISEEFNKKIKKSLTELKNREIVDEVEALI